MRGRIVTGKPSVDRSFDDLRGSVGTIESCPLLSGRHLVGVELSSGVTRRIPTGLGRRWQGWLVTDLVGASTTGRIERVVDDDANVTRELWLKATGWGATITVSLWVF